MYEGRGSDAPVDVRLIDDQGTSIRIMSGTDCCLVVETSQPYKAWDTDDWGRVDVLPVRDETPLADHVGAAVLGVREEWEPRTGRAALEVDFTSGSVRCESGSGDLRVLRARASASPPGTGPMP